MKSNVLLGRGSGFSEMPWQQLEHHLAQIPEHHENRLRFMSQDHHRVRDYAVTQLVRIGAPLSPERISQDLKLALDQVNILLGELEKHLFFLVRSKSGAVAWAFPITTDVTPHRLTFSTGEQIYAAWAEDAIAAPFVQGQLRREFLEVEIETACAHCDQRIAISLDSDLNYSVRQEDAQPLVFTPDVNWAKLTDPNIIHAYWNNSLFFWSEEHARIYREAVAQPNGTYLTLDQAARVTRVAQGALFAFRTRNSGWEKRESEFASLCLLC